MGVVTLPCRGGVGVRTNEYTLLPASFVSTSVLNDMSSWGYVDIEIKQKYNVTTIDSSQTYK